MIHDTQSAQISQNQDGPNIYHALCLACWVRFGSLVLAMCNGPSCAQVHELPQSHFGDNREGTLLSWLHVYYTLLASVRFEYSVCRGSLMTSWGYQCNFALSVSRKYFSCCFLKYLLYEWSLKKRTFFHKFGNVLCILMVDNAVNVCAASKVEHCLELLFSLLQSLQSTLRYM